MRMDDYARLNRQVFKSPPPPWKKKIANKKGKNRKKPGVLLSLISLVFRTEQRRLAFRIDSWVDMMAAARLVTFPTGSWKYVYN